MNTYTYLGNTAQSLAFRATNAETGDVMDFGVFNFAATYETDENGQPTDVIITPANPVFSSYFGLFVNESGEFMPNVIGFDLACEAYLNAINWQWPQPEQIDTEPIDTEPTE
jgi:hypothetical protein